MRQELEALGAGTVEGVAQAEVCVVNTCTVTNQADADARRFIRRIRRENPGIRVVVAGCSPALDPNRYGSMEGVVGVVEGHDPVEVAKATLGGAEGAGCFPGLPSRHRADLVQLAFTGSPRASQGDRTGQDWTGGGLEGEGLVGGDLLRKREAGTRGWLKIQDGCDRKCSFCATRLARGASRSRPPGEVVAEARLLARSHPELVLTGIHIGHYGRDLEDRATLSELVAVLLDRVPEVRFRLGSVEATEVDDLLVELMESSGGRLAPHLHMPMQSGSDPVLKRMRRWHTRETYRRRAMEVAERFPVLGLGADIITGFPGETREDHARTRALVEEIPFTYLHVFPFSPREGTAARDMLDPVPQRVAGERGKELRELALEKGKLYRSGRVGESAFVVLEGDGGWALTEDYLRVAVNAPSGTEAWEAEGILPGRLGGSGEHLNIDLSRTSSD